MDKEKSLMQPCLYFTVNGLSRILIGANNIRQLEENIGQADLKLAEEDIRALDGLTEVAAPYPVSHLDASNELGRTGQGSSWGKLTPERIAI